MKKNMIMRFASALLILTLLSTCAISGTFAKYTSEKEASDSARIAKWEFTVGKDDDAANIATTDMVFDLFNTINDTDGNPETDVDTNLIAPGTQGSFDIVLANLSEVTAEYAVTFSANLAGVPLQFKTKVGDATASEWTDTITSLNIATDDSHTTALDMKTGTVTITVYWQWVFNGNDTTDTDLGKVGTATPQVTAQITATQVD